MGFDEGALIPQGLAGSPNYFGFSNNLVTFINCESLKEIGEMACVTPAQCQRIWTPPGQNPLADMDPFQI